MNHSVIDYMIFVYSTVEKKEVTYVPRFSSIDEASNFANLLRATLPDMVLSSVNLIPLSVIP